jgi:hypothetical protein
MKLRVPRDMFDALRLLAEVADDCQAASRRLDAVNRVRARHKLPPLRSLPVDDDAVIVVSEVRDAS